MTGITLEHIERLAADLAATELGNAEYHRAISDLLRSVRVECDDNAMDGPRTVDHHGHAVTVVPLKPHGLYAADGERTMDEPVWDVLLGGVSIGWMKDHYRNAVSGTNPDAVVGGVFLIVDGRTTQRFGLGRSTAVATARTMVDQYLSEVSS